VKGLTLRPDKRIAMPLPSSTRTGPVQRAAAKVVCSLAAFSPEPFTNVAPYGACNTDEDAMSWLPATRQCIVHDGMERCWFTHSPPSVDYADGQVPLLVSLHGAGGCSTLPAMGWGSKAADNGFVVAWPQGTESMSWGFNSTSWNDGTGCCGFGAEEAGIDDVGFLQALVAAELAGNQQLDPQRVYLTGHSNGGLMAQRLALQTTGVFAAVASMGASFAPDDPTCSPGCDSGEAYVPTPIIFVIGTADGTNPFYERASSLAGAFPSLTNWSRVNECLDNSPSVSSGGSVVLHEYTDCNGTEVALLEVPEAGHHAFGRGRPPFDVSPTNTIACCPFRSIPFFYEPDCEFEDTDTTQLAWEFLQRFSLG